MSDRPSSRDLAAELPVPASRPLADVLLDIATAPNTLAMLAVLWAGVAWLATQIPQVHGPAMATDGLSRPELLALHALSLDDLAWSLAVSLLTSLTVFVAVAVVLADRSWRRAPHALATVALLIVLAHWLWTTSAAPPVVLDVTIGAELATVPAWMADGGGPAPAPGRWKAMCKAPAGGEFLTCVVEGQGLRQQLDLSPGLPATTQGGQFTWLATSTSPLPTDMTVNWRAKPDARDVFAIALQDGVQSQAPLLSARLRPTVLKEVGPLVLVSDGGSQPGLRLLASPDVLPRGRPTAQVRGERVVRLQVAPSRTVLPLLAALLVLFASFVVTLRQPRTAFKVQAK